MYGLASSSQQMLCLDDECKQPLQDLVEVLAEGQWWLHKAGWNCEGGDLDSYYNHPVCAYHDVSWSDHKTLHFIEICRKHEQSGDALTHILSVGLVNFVWYVSASGSAVKDSPRKDAEYTK